jgi:hypothetical protein
MERKEKMNQRSKLKRKNEKEIRRKRYKSIYSNHDFLHQTMEPFHPYKTKKLE